MAKQKSYYGFNKNRQNTGYEKYTPGTVGKIAVGITTSSLIIAVAALVVTLFTKSAYAFAVTMITVVISVLGSLVIMGDIIAFNHRQKNRQKKSASDSQKPKEPDMARAGHMIVGILVGVIIGYLIWGN